MRLERTFPSITNSWTWLPKGLRTLRPVVLRDLTQLISTHRVVQSQLGTISLFIVLESSNMRLKLRQSNAITTNAPGLQRIISNIARLRLQAHAKQYRSNPNMAFLDMFATKSPKTRRREQVHGHRLVHNVHGSSTKVHLGSRMGS